MSESMRMWTEISFNIAYLIVVYGLVIAMIRRRQAVSPENRMLSRLFIWAFALLALGDTGHVGFRVWAYALGSLESTINLGSWKVGLVGAGALATAVTVTFFYMIVLVIWQKRFQKPYGWFGMLLFTAAIFRLIIMMFPANEWNNTVPPQPWGIIRNAPLILQGIGVAYLILRDAVARKDRTFIGVGTMIIVSYAFYMPVILFVQQIPMLGMLMIPKTLAYVAIAYIAYHHLFSGIQNTTFALT